LQDKAERLLMEMLAGCALSFNLVENALFCKFVNAISSEFVVKGRKHYTNVVLTSTYDREISRVRKEVLAASHVSLTTDIWTSKNNKQSLLAVTGKF
jgi:hypothetical protein